MSRLKWIPEMLKPRLWLEALCQGIGRAPQGIWRSEGGRGWWRLFEERFAGHARSILDFSHVAQQLWKGAAAWLEGRPTRARRWFVWARHRLRHGMPDGVLAALTDARVVEGVPATARDTCARYMPTWNGIASTSTRPRTRRWGCRWAVVW